ncbi:helix-turn-helix domain-containing protein [Streptomyces sp. NPDC017993]|uniref:helix-turn-helix domain-containing protein n=1 Tax=Streptomyces sp. NPDC017993 TaxID=3365027 RepID=UPI0037955CFA
MSFAEREQIALWRAQDVGVREIARRPGPLGLDDCEGVAGLGTPAAAGARPGTRDGSRRGCVWTIPDDPTMRISHEAIYQALCIAKRGGRFLEGGFVTVPRRRPGRPQARPLTPTRPAHTRGHRGRSGVPVYGVRRPINSSWTPTPTRNRSAERPCSRH